MHHARASFAAPLEDRDRETERERKTQEYPELWLPQPEAELEEDDAGGHSTTDEHYWNVIPIRTSHSHVDRLTEARRVAGIPLSDRPIF